MVLLNAKFANEHSFKKFPNFSLENIDHRLIDSDEIAGENGLLVMFICNHCPYVKAIVKNIVQDVNDLKNMGINSVAINSNDATEYPEDSFEKMIEFAKSHNFSFPYLVDKTQKVAKEFGAVCTPDFFLFTKDKDRNLILSHKGRLNDFIYTKSGLQTSDGLIVQRELIIIAQYLTGKSRSSMGCSIKWRD
jgi:peroxiredoxin